MPYTIADWVREHARIRVQLPSPDGGTMEAWVPLDALTGEGGEYPRWYAYRTSVGYEAADFVTWQSDTDVPTVAEDEEREEARNPMQTTDKDA